MSPFVLLIFAFVSIFVMLRGMILQSLSAKGILSPTFENETDSKSKTRSYDDDKMTPNL